MTVTLVIIAALIALVGYAFGTKAGRRRYQRLERGARKAWSAPEVKKGRARVQKLAKQNAKKIDKALRH
jgi:SLT domain-containing protein